jgi:hypothetical protein
VVVVTHDGERHIGACLASLIDGGTAAEDVLVVDNASADGTIRVVRDRFPHVRVIAAEANLGYGGGVNLALGAADGDFLVVMNQDVSVRPGFVDALVRALDADSGAGLATPRILLRSDPRIVNACGNEITYLGFTTCRGFGRAAAVFDSIHPVMLVSGAAFIIRRDLLHQLGGMDPLFFMYLEDADLSLRARLAGSRSICVPSATAVHDWEPSFSAAKIHWLERNRILLPLRLYRARTLVLIAPALLLAELLVLGYAVLRGPSVVAAKLAAWRWIVGSSGRIAGSRRRVQRTRTITDRVLLGEMNGAFNVDELPGRLPGLVAGTVNPLFRLWFGLVRKAVTW